MGYYKVIFQIRCDICGQTLAPLVTDESVVYTHDNPADCVQLGITLPLVTPEDLTKAFGAAEKPRTVQPRATKTASKKKK